MTLFHNFHKAINATLKGTHVQHAPQPDTFNDSGDDDFNTIPMGLIVFMFIVVILLACFLLYVVFLSFKYALMCNYNNKDQMYIELVVLFFGFLLFPIINIFYVLIKPGDCVTDPSRPRL